MPHTQSLPHDPGTSRFRSLPALGALATAVLTAILTTVATWSAFRIQDVHLSGLLNQQGIERVNALARRLEDCERSLGSVRDLYAASNEVDRDELVLFTESILGAHPELSTLGWIPAKSNSWSREGLLGLLHTDQDLVLADSDTRTLPGWPDALEEARATGRPTLASHWEPGSGEEAWIIQPVNDKAAPGWLVGLLNLRVTAELSSAVGPLGHGLDLLLYDGDPSPSHLRLDHSWGMSRAPANKSVLDTPHFRRTVRIAGNGWTAIARPRLGWGPGGGWLPWSILAGGFLSTLALLWLHVLATRRARSLRRSNESLIAEVARRVQSEAALEKAAAEARAANEAKARFMTSVSHELRTPLNGILGVATELEEELGAPQRDALRILRASGELLLSLVDDVLDFTRLDHGRLDLHPRPEDLGELFRSTVERHRSKSEAGGIELRLHVDTSLPDRVAVDPTRFQQVVTILVGNAVKFGGDGKVEARLELEDRGRERVRVRGRVRDQGPGISRERQEALFHPFRQVDESMSRSHGGLGLGLSIAKAIVERMDGQIGIESEVGQGCEVWFTVTLDRVPVEEALEDPPAPLPHRWEDLHVLLVEDNPVNQRIAKRVLDRAGFTFDVAENGREALEALDCGAYDVVLMDCQMPVMDGYTAASEIRRREEGEQHQPIVALTAHALPEERERCMEVGMDGFVAKPFQPEELLATIQRVIGGESPQVSVKDRTAHSDG